MEKQEKINLTIRIFSFLFRETVDKSFSFPGGGIAKRKLADCIDSLDKVFKGELTEERLTDYCICQVYVLRNYSEQLLKRWSASHSFGKNALQRFYTNTKGKRYYEDLWLKSHGLSRSGLLEMHINRKEHPLQKFIYADYEENTKQRMHNSEVGFYICQLSTLLWNPFSDICNTCKNKERCIQVLQKKYPELYRLRMEESAKIKGV